jgi:hypothetical protein
MQTILGSWNAASVQANNSASRLAQELEQTHSASSFEAFNFALKVLSSSSYLFPPSLFSLGHWSLWCESRSKTPRY